jgi:hypothetical protein
MKSTPTLKHVTNDDGYDWYNVWLCEYVYVNVYKYAYEVYIQFSILYVHEFLFLFTLN